MVEVEKLEQDPGKYIKGEKRQYLPFKIHWTCPMCGQQKTMDLSDKRYLSYPKWNTENSDTLYCGDCGTELRVKIVPEVNISVEVIDQ